MKIPEHNKNPILIYGTSPDYVKKIFEKYENDIIFIMDSSFKESHYLKDLTREDLFFTHLDGSDESIGRIAGYIFNNNFALSGIGCFDCESLICASRLAVIFDLPFPSVDGISKARNKHQSKQIWGINHVNSPKSTIAGNLKETVSFYKKTNNPIVIKPLSSSGSELTFYCENESQVTEAVDTMSLELANRISNPFFQKLPAEKGLETVDPLNHWVAEEYIYGTEFSCDFICRDGKITVIRLTEKIKDNEQTFGSILAYSIPANLPEGFSMKAFVSDLKMAVCSLGMNCGWFMADFIVNNITPYIIEITPRPGGDSIPDLIETATGQDILGSYLDFMSGRLKDVKQVEYSSGSLTSLNIFSPDSGIITELDFSGISTLPWVKKTYALRRVGDRIILPPFNYDNRILGYCIIDSSNYEDLKRKQCTLLEKIRLSFINPEENLPINNTAQMISSCYQTG